MPVTIACVLLGILVAVQFRAQAAHQPHERVAQWGDMKEMLKSYEAERNKLQVELSEARTRIKEIEDKLAGEATFQKDIKAQFEQARIQAGLMGMKGPGVLVRMVDAARRPAPGEDPYFYIVHDVDVQALVNELWAAGAEAIAVNDQRIVTRSSIRCVGPTILVNANRLAPPYVVKAIGPPGDLEGGLRMPGGFLDSMSMLVQAGGQVDISRMQEVTVAAYEGSLVYRYASPLKEGEGEDQTVSHSEPEPEF